MAKYRLNRQSHKETDNHRNPYLVDDTYYDDIVDVISETDYDSEEHLYDNSYFDETNGKQVDRLGFVGRMKQSYQNAISTIKDEYDNQVEYQKSYYEDGQAHWMQKQQAKRDSEFIRKLMITVALLVVISGLVYLLSHI